MASLSTSLRKWGNAGAVLNARDELVRSHQRTVDANIVARRVERRDTVRVRAANKTRPSGRVA